MQCPNGHEITDDVHFCPVCGAQINPQASETPEAGTSAPFWPPPGAHPPRSTQPPQGAQPPAPYGQQKKGLWRGRSKRAKGGWIALAVIVALVIAAAVAPSNDDQSSPSAAADVAATPAASDPSDAITGRVDGNFHRDCLFCGDLKPYIETSDAWCGWKGDTLLVHVTMTNTSVEHVTVSWHPSYVIEGGTEHGAGLGSVQDDGFDSEQTRDLLAEQHPEGVSSGAVIAECKPSFSLIESG
jgi:hypothetical protein